MKYSEARQGRVFVIRLEDGDIVHEALEQFAREKSIRAAAMIVIGGADAGSRLVVGPEAARAAPMTAMERVLENVHEVVGTGTLFPDGSGVPMLHMHMACGREGDTVTGCIRQGVKVWHVMEVILFELLDATATRVPEPETGLKLLKP